MGIGSLIVGGIILACTGDDDIEKYKCPHCSEIVTKREEKCPNCKTKFDWDEDEEVTLYSDEYYLEYAKSLPPINKEMKAQIFNLLKGLGEVTKLEKPIKDYSKINTREDYLNSVSCMHAVIQTAKDEKKYETAVIFTIYFVKYYTKLILKYGNKEEKMILASYVNILKTLKN